METLVGQVANKINASDRIRALYKLEETDMGIYSIS